VYSFDNKTRHTTLFYAFCAILKLCAIRRQY